ncbi:Fic family protein [Piscinibacter sp.]|uniref:Fic family protein n=1 Tax=Piscinibacter sp. TaxID=1903157 RepID=UPI002C2B6ABA|nr:Fic family protein [Albitalea sp.]HUG21184.1 Fic family protein [Albitalea sp.]
MRPRVLGEEEALAILRSSDEQGKHWLSSSEFAKRAGVSWSTGKRVLDQLTAKSLVLQTGQSRATRYRLAAAAAAAADAADQGRILRNGMGPGTRYGLPKGAVPDEQRLAAAVMAANATVAPPWSDASMMLLNALEQPLGVRTHVTYQRKFVDDYAPNESSLLPRELAQALAAEGRMQGQQPAGTYARKVLEPLLLDLSWSSSKLEGNKYSLLDTEQLFKTGAGAGDLDAVMLLNHKNAIEFLVDAVPSHGLSGVVVRNLHAVLMQDLLADSSALGAVRSTVVNISDTVYLPAQVPALLDEMLALIIDKARQIKNPVEAAFFLWVHIAYLQPFEDGNKRTSRLAANIPLMLYNCSPLSFLEVRQIDYAMAMLGVYEQLDVSVAVDLFAWTYRRSLQKYRVVLEATGQPDPFRIRYREALNDGVGAVVRDARSLDEAVGVVEIASDDRDHFRKMLADELEKLTEFNFSRYRLTLEAFSSWVTRGRPR